MIISQSFNILRKVVKNFYTWSVLDITCSAVILLVCSCWSSGNLHFPSNILCCMLCVEWEAHWKESQLFTDLLWAQELQTELLQWGWMFQTTLSHVVFKSGIYKTRKGGYMSFILCRIYKNCQYANYTGVFLFHSFWWSYWHWDLLQLVSEEACSWSRNSTQIGFWENIHTFINSKWKEQNSSQIMEWMLEFILEDWTTVQNFQIFIDFWHN